MSQTLKLYIPKVLSENKIVLLKGIGTLQMNYRPAEIDLDAGTLDAPREEIFFVPANERKLDPVLIRVVEIIARVDEDEAADLVENFMNDLQGELTLNGFLTFPNIGWIKQDHWGSLFFEPAAEYIAINRFFGFNKVKLPEALSPAEQEVIADLKETAAERTAQDSLVVEGNRNRNWGFIIGVGLMLIMFICLSFLFKPNNPSPQLSNLTVLSHEQDSDLFGSSQVQTTMTTNNEDHEGEALGSEEKASLAAPLDAETSDPDPISPVFDEQCVVVVGAFREENNVDRMVTRLADSDFQSIVIEGPTLTKVGLRYGCNDDPQYALAWAKEHIDSDAWLYKMD